MNETSENYANQLFRTIISHILGKLFMQIVPSDFDHYALRMSFSDKKYLNSYHESDITYFVYFDNVYESRR